ncbi:putative hydroxymethylpyrimidine transport system permease protein [Rhodobacter aestuarii]|uniref:Putative hydroxymethylpyrimidine transport system permease protein n=1 Tax=Rhodobacter aestuarii TaxID=453582 RepID=A0A1N7J0R8_9RHOB|nr:ABC transporter permease [Rhodobacter aestuarii]PTV97320.1 putative hydroxymethylpyrimidine transport system permease protein [Rhodobacter aestuarii]SIS42811.1 putative hydroxymethylpyrimidine transport system permease protein [Rhodobacter aestuarii]
MRRVWPVLLPLIAWQALTSLGLVAPFILPAPLAVVRTLWSEVALIAPHALVSLSEVLAGLVLGLALGVSLALAMALSDFLSKLCGPLLSASQALPVFVLAPILTLWLGYGAGPKVAMVVLLVVFPVASGLYDGLCATPEPVRDLARITKAHPLRALWWLRLPHALPQLGAGLRIAVTYAPTGAVIGEWVGASKGLGYLMLMANARMRTELMFAALLAIVAMTLVLNLATSRILRRFGM